MLPSPIISLGALKANMQLFLPLTKQPSPATPIWLRSNIHRIPSLSMPVNPHTPRTTLYGMPNRKISQQHTPPSLRPAASFHDERPLTDLRARAHTHATRVICSALATSLQIQTVHAITRRSARLQRCVRATCRHTTQPTSWPSSSRRRIGQEGPRSGCRRR